MMGVFLFEIAVIAFTVWLWYFMRKKGYKNVSRKFIILFIGVLLFEIMSEPMWVNSGFHSWAYIYRDVTWILTLGWVSIFMSAFLLVDYSFSQKSEKTRFWLYLLCVEGITVPIEMALLQTGVRGYAEVLSSTMTGFTIPLTAVPIEAVYAIPLFAALIIGFYKYVNYLVDTNGK